MVLVPRARREYYSKTPLFAWFNALCTELLRATAFYGRLPVVAFATACVWVIYPFAACVLDRLQNHRCSDRHIVVTLVMLFFNRIDKESDLISSPCRALIMMQS